MRSHSLDNSEQIRNDNNILPIISDADWPIQQYAGDIKADLASIDNVKTAQAIIGNLSYTDKMPGPSFNLPASACPVGSRMRHVKGSICSICYAADSIEWRKEIASCLGTGLTMSNFISENTRRANAYRLHALRDRMWVPAMVYALRYGDATRGVDYMRWMSSGDVQSLNHFHNIISVAQHTPHTQHWVPTNEHVNAKRVKPPKNMVIRASARMVDGPPPKGFANVSTVSTGVDPSHGGLRCEAAASPVYQCGSCRSCWDTDVVHIDYHEKRTMSDSKKCT